MLCQPQILRTFHKHRVLRLFSVACNESDVFLSYTGRDKSVAFARTQNNSEVDKSADAVVSSAERRLLLENITWLKSELQRKHRELAHLHQYASRIQQQFSNHLRITSKTYGPVEPVQEAVIQQDVAAAVNTTTDTADAEESSHQELISRIWLDLQASKYNGKNLDTIFGTGGEAMPKDHEDLFLSKSVQVYPIEPVVYNHVQADILQARLEYQQGQLLYAAQKKYNSSLDKSSLGSGIPGKNLPNEDQLQALQNYFVDFIPRAMTNRHDYRLYRMDLEFFNNWVNKPYSTITVSSYAMKLTKMRTAAHFLYANVRMEVVKITSHPEDGTIRIRWRVKGIPQLKAFMFWKFLPGYKKGKNKEAVWLDGYSVLSVDADGAIYKHVMDKVMPDEEKEFVADERAAMAAKYGIVPGPDPL